MDVKNTRKMQNIRNVVATMAIENMYLNRDFISELIQVDKGEKTTEELRQEVLKKYVG
ncbi:MAG: antitoxin VbhA family protein [Lachnospiraceae bacterium]|nr:antitoxin VbhA family protein [Lachnospiraceae bacterium]MDD5853491.1 antitoxin VbhA family protein [Lachnospiraceae bacterium]